MSTASLDYAAINTLLEFPSGSTTGDVKCFDVILLSDDLSERTESFSLTVSALDEENSLISVCPSHSKTTVFIIDDDSKEKLMTSCIYTCSSLIPRLFLLA